MKVILDTNVLVSGIFFKGPPNGFSDLELKINTIVISMKFLKNTIGLLKISVFQFSQIDISNLLKHLPLKAHLTLSLTWQSQICDDPDDDKFFSGSSRQ